MRRRGRRFALVVAVGGSILLWAPLGPAGAGFGGAPPAPLTSWGDNSQGQLGNATTSGSSLPGPVALPAGVGAISVSAAGAHVLVIGSDGQLYSWGDNSFGQVGDGTTVNRPTPEVVTLAPGVTPVSVAAGQNHSLAVGSDGHLYAWGYNGWGQLGDGTTTSVSAPEPIALPGGATPRQIGAGDNQSFAAASDGRLYGWGFNVNGQLGNGTTANSDTPVAVLLPAGVSATAVASGLYHSVAIGSDGHTYAWGVNSEGELGDGTGTNSTVPVQVHVPAGVTLTSVSCGEYHTVAVGSDGHLYAWGYNYYGQLGDGTTEDAFTPEAVPLPGGKGKLAVAGAFFSLGVAGNGQLFAWGQNSEGQLGDGTTNEAPQPEPVRLSEGTGPHLVAAGTAFALADEVTEPPPPHPESLHLVAADGTVYATGSAGLFGSMAGRPLNKPMVAMAVTPDGQGYWLVAADGGVFAFGDAGFYGSMGGRPLNRPVTGIAPTTDGRGYWLVATDGGVFAFGDAGFFGSMGGQPLNAPVTGAAATPGGAGYWLVGTDGGIFAFGDAGYFGSMGGRPLNRPVTGLAATPEGGGYWLVARDGGVFSFGDATFAGSAAGTSSSPFVAIVAAPVAPGYWLVTAAASVVPFGSADQLASPVPTSLSPVVGASR